MKILNPCKNCPDRHPICHDSCPRYAEYKRQLKAQRIYTNGNHAAERISRNDFDKEGRMDGRKKTVRTHKPPIGTPMWHVLEHLYYEKTRAGPLMEYMVREARVTGYFQGGYTEIRLTGKNAGGYLTPFSYPLSDIGRRLFYTPEEAAQLAKRMTENEEKMLWCSDPLRRPWAEYIMPVAEQTSLFQKVSR